MTGYECPYWFKQVSLGLRPLRLRPVRPRDGARRPMHHRQGSPSTPGSLFLQGPLGEDPDTLHPHLDELRLTWNRSATCSLVRPSKAARRAASSGTSSWPERYVAWSSSLASKRRHPSPVRIISLNGCSRRWWLSSWPMLVGA